jgi:hypothetical protein
MSALVLQYLLTALSALPALVAAGGELATEIGALQTQLKLFQSQNRDPTVAEWAAQNANLSSALTALLAPKGD